MRNSILYFVLIAFILNISYPINVYAGEYQRDAMLAVAKEELRIHDEVKNMVLRDVRDLAENILLQSSPVNHELQKLKILDRKLAEVSLGFEKIASLKSNEINDLKTFIQAEIASYSDINRYLFSLSWTPSTAAILQKNFLEQLNLFIESFQYRCEEGQNLYGYTGMSMAVPPDPVMFSVNFNTGNAEESSANYEQYNYSSKTWNKTGAIAASTFGIAASVYFSAGSTGMASAAGGVAAAAAIVVVVAMIANHIHGTKKYNKVMRDYFNGEVYKVYNAPNSQRINTLYKEKCRFVLNKLLQVRPLIEDIYQGGANKARAFEIIRKNASLENTTDKDGREYVRIAHRKQVLENYKNNYCKEVEVYTPDLEQHCQITKDDELTKNYKPEKTILYCEYKTCEIENPDVSEIENLHTQEEKLYASIASNNIDLVFYKVFNDVFVNAETFIRTYDSEIFRKAFASRQIALNRLKVLINVYEKVIDDKIDSDLNAQKNYLSARKEFNEVLAASFDYIFEKVDKPTVTFLIKKLEPKINLLRLKYVHIDEVQDLSNAFNYLKNFMADK